MTQNRSRILISFCLFILPRLDSDTKIQKVHFQHPPLLYVFCFFRNYIPNHRQNRYITTMVVVDDSDLSLMIVSEIYLSRQTSIQTTTWTSFVGGGGVGGVVADYPSL